MEENKLLSPKIDVVFQALFGEVGNEEVTKALLKVILKQKIEEVNLNQNPILRREFENDKLGILDILAKVNEKENCNIELQVVDKANMIERILYYWAKLYSKGIKKGEDYKDLARTVVVLITEYDILEKEKLEIHTKWQIIEEKERKIILTEKFELHIINLSKINTTKSKDKELLEWLYFLDNPESERVKQIMKTNKEIKTAKEKLNQISQDEKMRRIAELRQKAIMDEKAIYRKGNEVGFAEGEKQGIAKRNNEIAKKMKDKGMGTETIVELTGLTKEEIEKL